MTHAYIVSYRFTGKVQDVMFRQTLIRACLREKIVSGASNRIDGISVDATFLGDKVLIDKIINFIEKKNILNSWSAKADSVELLDVVIPVENHQVTTINVDKFNWSSNVEMYL